jgi:hypothetical protein
MILQFVFGKTGSVALDVDTAEFGAHEMGRIVDDMAKRCGGVQRVNVLPEPVGYKLPTPVRQFVALSPLTPM